MNNFKEDEFWPKDIRVGQVRVIKGPFIIDKIFQPTRFVDYRWSVSNELIHIYEIENNFCKFMASDGMCYKVGMRCMRNTNLVSE